ncbi:hypothetical protein [Cellulomonas sp. ICMP 17802]|uniref:hypothetical protein n=1 Tax=Cellulomonas sp. ICMP 17802 TaxID=3239199 RepID=UPI00351AD1D7
MHEQVGVPGPGRPAQPPGARRPDGERALLWAAATLAASVAFALASLIAGLAGFQSVERVRDTTRVAYGVAATVLATGVPAVVLGIRGARRRRGRAAGIVALTLAGPVVSLVIVDVLAVARG